MEMIPSPWLGFLRGVFLTNHLASNDNLTRTTKTQNTYQQKLAIHKKGPNKQQKKYKTKTRPGLVAFYDIRPGNAAGLFLQPWSPHRAVKCTIVCLRHSLNLNPQPVTWGPFGPHSGLMAVYFRSPGSSTTPFKVVVSVYE